MNVKLEQFQNLSLRAILILYVVAPLALSFGLAGYFTLQFWEHKVEAQMKTDLETVAKSIQLPLSHAMERDRQGGIEQALESAFSIDGIYSAYAYDVEGRQIGVAGEQDPAPERNKLTELASDGKRTGEFGRVGDRRVYSYFVPLKDSHEQVTGLLQLTRREQDFRDYIRQVRRHALAWLGLGVLVMSALVILGHHHALGRHFQRLTSSMQRVAAGDVQHRIRPSGPKEIAAIGNNFNTMLDSIKEAEDTLRSNREKQLVLEKQLRQNEKLAAIGQLTAGVAHELGTPLSTISATAQRGLRSEPADTKTAGAFNRILDAVRSMEIIIHQLLNFSHPRKIHKRELNAAQVAESAMTAVTDMAKQAHVTMRSDIDHNPPPFEADPIHLEQILVNLLKNAIQASNDGGLVEIHAYARDNRIFFRIDDDGPGVPENIRQRLFEPFFTTKKVGSGTGLGLAVVHGIVKEHDGDITVATSAMNGARFELSLPLHTTDGDKKT